MTSQKSHDDWYSWIWGECTHVCFYSRDSAYDCVCTHTPMCIMVSAYNTLIILSFLSTVYILNFSENISHKTINIKIIAPTDFKDQAFGFWSRKLNIFNTDCSRSLWLVKTINLRSCQYLNISLVHSECKHNKNNCSV